MRRVLMWLKRGLLVLLVALAALAVVAAAVPVPTDELPPPDRYGAGASSVEPSYSGLRRAFPLLPGGDWAPPFYNLWTLASAHICSWSRGFSRMCG